MTGIKAFLTILFLMPLGHAAMALMNKHLPGSWLYAGAWALFLAGFLLIVLTRFIKSAGWQSFLGAFSGVFMWTGVVEYGFIYGAEQLGVGELNGSKGEYRLLTHTWSLVLLLSIYLLFHESVRCNFFVWLRRKLKLLRGPAVHGKVENYGPRTAFEMISVLWFFYVVMLLLYDENIFGVHHPATYLFLLLSLAGSVWLLYRLVRIADMGHALRYAIPTVIIFWNAIEILIKWKIFSEPWITLNLPIMATILAAFVAGVYCVVKDLRKAGR